MVREIIFYTTHCPRCEVLKKKMTAKGIQFVENTDIDEMNSKNISHVPVLEIDGVLMDFTKANEWINRQESEQ